MGITEAVLLLIIAIAMLKALITGEIFTLSPQR